jgi:hypothetical protein
MSQTIDTSGNTLVKVTESALPTGAATSAAQTTAQTALDAIKTAVEILDNTVSGSEQQVDVVTVPAPLSTTGGGTEATALRVTLASDSTGVVSVDDNGGALTVDGTVGVSGTVTVDGSGVTQPVSHAGLTALNGAISGTEVQVDVLTMPTTTVQATNLDVRDLTAASDNVAIRPEAADGLSLFRSIDLDETEEEVKATAGQLYGVWFSNLATSTRFLKFYNATAANVTVGTTTPVLTLALPGNTSDDISGVFSTTHGIAFGTAITVAATTGLADNDTGAPGGNEVVVNIFYK